MVWLIIEILGVVDGQPVPELSKTGLDVHKSIQSSARCTMKKSKQWHLLLSARHWIVIYSPGSQSRILGLGEVHEITGPGLTFICHHPSLPS